MPERFLKLAAVCENTGFSKSTVYREIGAGKFPAPYRIGGRARWLESEVDEYIRRVVAEAGEGAA